MDVNALTERLKSYQERLNVLYEELEPSVQQKTTSLWLAAAQKELGVASEEIQVALEQLVIQVEELAATRIELEAECQYYKKLFEFSSNACILTNALGKILQANQVAAILLNIEPRFLVGKPLDIFFTQEERGAFPAKLKQLHQCDQPQKWTIRLQPRNKESLNVAAMVAPSHDSEGNLTTLRWTIDKINQNKLFGQEQENNHLDFISQNYPRYTYQKGEIIPLEPSSIWIVCRGWVKLSTVAQNGEELLLGLIKPTMLFGSNLTSLPTYQATALSEKVQLVSVSLEEITNSYHLRETLFSQTIQRLQQTEYFLAISGKRHTEDRLHDLLSYLKQNFSEKVSEGTRLSIRLTHQELADACRTTRVTITRLLSKLKKQSLIKYDSEYHIIFLKERGERREEIGDRR